MGPDPSCLAPLGEEPLEKGMRKFFKPDFFTVIQRSASAYSGFPFVVEMGIAYGGEISTLVESKFIDLQIVFHYSMTKEVMLL